MACRVEHTSALPGFLDDVPWGAEELARCESELLDQVCEAVIRMGEAFEQSAPDALAQLATGTYGYCLDCHSRIPPQRLDAVAFAVRCATCERARRGLMS
jgi:RNA polymerase-binding transcription factor DksA